MYTIYVFVVYLIVHYFLSSKGNSIPTEDIFHLTVQGTWKADLYYLLSLCRDHNDSNLLSPTVAQCVCAQNYKVIIIFEV
jgi:hypothetical protein